MIDAALLEPFWASTVMHRESLLFVEQAAGEPTAGLLFCPDHTVSLTSASGEVCFDEGRDYAVDKASGQLRRLPGSRVPFTMRDELYPSVASGGSGFMYRRDDPRMFLMYGEGDLFHRRQCTATYGHPANQWRGSVPRFEGVQLRRTFQRLIESKPLTICLTGDSISEGYNASGFIGVPPYQAGYGPLVVAGLEHAYGTSISFHNFAVAGWTADDGVAAAAQVAAAQPDLVIIAFGMNDAGYADAAMFSDNINEIMNEIRKRSVAAEFVLVSPMLPHPDWHYPLTGHFQAYRDALARLRKPGVVLADLTTLWTDLLTRKSVHDLSGNGINHPNDFGHRLYAQVILALLVEPRCPAERVRPLSDASTKR